MPIVLKSGSLNLLEPSKPTKGSTGVTIAFKNNFDSKAEAFCSVLGKRARAVSCDGQEHKTASASGSDSYPCFNRHCSLELCYNKSVCRRQQQQQQQQHCVASTAGQNCQHRQQLLSNCCAGISPDLTL